MGYSHRFEKTRKPTSEEWSEITRVAKWVINNARAPYLAVDGAFDSDPIEGQLTTYVERRDPRTGRLVAQAFEVNHTTANVLQLMERVPAIVFDGKGSLGEEAFVLTSAGPQQDREISPCIWFCDTAHKPYDLLVCCVLILIDNATPGLLKIRSDGDMHDWTPALRLARRFDASVNLPLSIDPNSECQPAPRSNREHWQSVQAFKAVG